MPTPSENLSFELYQPHHYQGLKETMQTCFADLEESFADEEELDMLSTLYPRGQIVCLLDGKVIGANIARVVPFAKYSMPHTQAECIDKSLFLPELMWGDAVYGLDVFVDPQYQNLKIGKQIVDLLVKHTFEDNFRCMIGISRTVNYAAHQHEMDCATYAEKVRLREIYDPALSFHIRNGMEFVNVSPNFSDDDVASAGFGIILQIPNPNFDPNKPIFPERAHLLRKVERTPELVHVA
jgi:ribosomal protein S18 acetylase RimI-like enzyme